jgi:hypothetical protein
MWTYRPLGTENGPGDEVYFAVTLYFLRARRNRFLRMA